MSVENNNSDNNSFNINDFLNQLNSVQQSSQVSNSIDNSNNIVKASALDEVINNQQMQIIKTAIPYLNYELQRQIAVVIKFLELKNTFQIYNNNNFNKIQALNLMSHPKESMLQSVRTVCSDDNKNLIDIIINILNINKLMNTYKNLQAQKSSQKQEQSISNDNNSSETISTEEETNTANNTIDSNSSSTSNPNFSLDMLKNMLSPEQRNMFDMLSMLMKPQ